jgi:phosphoribosylglycinamide formyltransferase-1
VSSHEAPQPVLVMISGRGSNMLALIEAGLADPNSGYRVAGVLSDRADAAGLAAAARLGVPTAAIPAGAAADRPAYDRLLAAEIERFAPRLIALAGFMRILGPDLVRAYEGRILNIHPSLLPEFPGLHTHRRALEAGRREHGATVHFVTAELDAGPAVLQGRVPIRPGDDEASLARRVLEVEHKIYPLALRWYCEGRLRWRDRGAWLDGKELDKPIQFNNL